jgi:hypothetical protein
MVVTGIIRASHNNHFHVYKIDYNKIKINLIILTPFFRRVKIQKNMTTTLMQNCARNHFLHNFEAGTYTLFYPFRANDNATMEANQKNLIGEKKKNLLWTYR